MKLNNFFKFIISISLPILAGIIGSIFTTPSIDLWYSTLIKPALNPPSWVFAPTWTSLYVLMGISMFLVWKKGFNRKDVKIALLIFITQLILNSVVNNFFCCSQHRWSSNRNRFPLVYNSCNNYRICKNF